MKYLCSSVIAGSVLPELLLCRRRGKGTRGEGKTAALTIPTGRMMRGARLREAIGPPAMTQCKRAMMCSSSKTTEVMETSVPPIQSSESSMPDSKKGGATVSASMGVRPRWKPSEAHRGSATALRRKKVSVPLPQSANLSSSARLDCLIGRRCTHRRLLRCSHTYYLMLYINVGIR